jgi:DNA-binding CsgD family transcriptional regulator
LQQIGSQRTICAYEPLTERELEVLVWASKGYTNKVIGVQLGISDRSVQGHLAKCYGKLQANSHTDAVMRAVFGPSSEWRLGRLEIRHRQPVSDRLSLRIVYAYQSLTRATHTIIHIDRVAGHITVFGHSFGSKGLIPNSLWPFLPTPGELSRPLTVIPVA